MRNVITGSWKCTPPHNTERHPNTRNKPSLTGNRVLVAMCAAGVGLVRAPGLRDSGARLLVCNDRVPVLEEVALHNSDITTGARAVCRLQRAWVGRQTITAARPCGDSRAPGT